MFYIIINSVTLECGRRSGTVKQVTEQLGNLCQRGPGLIAFTCILLGDGDLNLPPLADREVPQPPAGTGAKEDLGTDKGVEGKGKEEDLALIPVAEGIQPVVRKIVRKVDNNEFVDFADLLQDQFAYEQDLSLPAAQSGLVLVQSLESLRKKKKKITDFQSWVEALMVFVAIKYRNANPEVWPMG